MVFGAIKRAAFTSSQLPLILALEIHCNVFQQQQVAVVLRATFKDILVERADYHLLSQPSPADLAGRILIRQVTPAEDTLDERTGEFLKETHKQRALDDSLRGIICFESVIDQSTANSEKRSAILHFSQTGINRMEVNETSQYFLAGTERTLRFA